MKNKKIDFLINQFKLTEDEAKKIEKVCKTLKAEKYLIWVAKEFKKDNDILSDTKNLIFIFDWVKKENVDVLKYDFKGLMDGSQEWHKANFHIIEKENNRNASMNDGVIYKCKDKKHFFKILSPDDLAEEGNMMGNCIGGYKDKLLREQSILISLRDEKNLPHVDIEIDVKTGVSLQILGKAGADGLQHEPIDKYKILILEYVFNSLGLKDEIDEEIMNLVFNKK